MSEDDDEIHNSSSNFPIMGVCDGGVVHCTAGCDRTGEFIGSYRLQFQGVDVYEMYQMDTDECGRSPNYWSTMALEW